MVHHQRYVEYAEFGVQGQTLETSMVNAGIMNLA